MVVRLNLYQRMVVIQEKAVLVLTRKIGFLIAAVSGIFQIGKTLSILSEA